jgi:hypothetical protein
MRRLAIMLAATSTLGFAAAAFAALPVKGPFAGRASLHPFNGFPALVTFAASANGRTLTKFQFETLGCFGHGQYPAGTDPFGDPTALGKIKSIPVTPQGSFLLTTKPVFDGADGTVTTATIKGTFSSSRSLSGTITLSQTANGDTCGPATMRFTAVPGTPESLGYDGP